MDKDTLNKCPSKVLNFNSVNKNAEPQTISLEQAKLGVVFHNAIALDNSIPANYLRNVILKFTYPNLTASPAKHFLFVHAIPQNGIVGNVARFYIDKSIDLSDATDDIIVTVEQPSIHAFSVCMLFYRPS